MFLHLCHVLIYWTSSANTLKMYPHPHKITYWQRSATCETWKIIILLWFTKSSQGLCLLFGVDGIIIITVNKPFFHTLTGIPEIKESQSKKVMCTLFYIMVFVSKSFLFSFLFVVVKVNMVEVNLLSHHAELLKYLLL